MKALGSKELNGMMKMVQETGRVQELENEMKLKEQEKGSKEELEGLLDCH